MSGVLGFIFLLTVNATPTSFYVSPSGNDTLGDGSISNPWKSIPVARDAVRGMIANGLSEDVTVYLREGVYELGSTLEFDVQDSAPVGISITYASKDGAGAAVLKSNSVITNSAGWAHFTNGIWRIQVGTGHDIDTLYEGGIRGIEARYPNRGANPLYPQARAPYLISVDGGITISNPDRSWVTYADKDFLAAPVAAAKYITIFPNGDRNWQQWICNVTSVATNINRINFNNFGNQTPLEGFERYFLSGALEYLDSKGEFHYDATAGYLYYRPRTPGNPVYKDISVPVLKTLVNIVGSDNASVVQGLKFDGLVFSDTAAVVPALHWWTFDWGKEDFAVVKMRNTANVWFEKCHVKNSGRHGILAVGHNEAIRIESSLVENAGVSGITLCNRFAGGTSDRIKNCVVTNCVVQNVGNLSLYAACIALMSTEYCIVDRCELYDSARYAVTLRGNALWDGVGFNSMPRSTDNIVRNCWIERCMQDSGDGGPLHEAGINNLNGPYINHFENIYIYNTYSVLGQSDPTQIAGIHLDWPGATMHQSFKNIWVDIYEAADFKVNNNPEQNFSNVSWEPGFDRDLLEFGKMGLSESLPSSFDFSPPVSDVFKDIVVDNNGVGFTEYGNDWNDSNVGRNKKDWLSPDAPNSRLYYNSFGTNFAAWMPDIKYAGYYDVYLWKFQTNATFTTGVVYTVVSSEATNDFTVSQQDVPEIWELLGTYYFEQGTNGFVMLNADSAAWGEQVRADAVRFIAISPEEEALWEESFDNGYTAGVDLIGQDNWTTWHGASPVVQSNSISGFFVGGVSSDDARAKRGIDSSVGTNRFVTVQFSVSIPDTASITLSQNHVGLGNHAANTMGVNVGINATGIFFCLNGIALNGFVYGYADGMKFVPDPAKTYAIKAVLNLLDGTARLSFSPDGTNFIPLSFDAAGTIWDVSFDTAQTAGWDSVYMRMGTHTGCRIYDVSVMD